MKAFTYPKVPYLTSQGRLAEKYRLTCLRAALIQFLSTIYRYHNQSSRCLMTDLSTVLPGFPTQQYVRLLPSLEKNLITTADLITLDVAEIAKRAQLPLLDLKRLCNAVLEALQVNLGVSDAEAPRFASLKRTGPDIVNSWNTISTLDEELDRALGGGIPTGYITEVTGERYLSSQSLRSGNNWQANRRDCLNN
jgi:hypothetical protein